MQRLLTRSQSLKIEDSYLTHDDQELKPVQSVAMAKIRDFESTFSQHVGRAGSARQVQLNFESSDEDKDNEPRLVSVHREFLQTRKRTIEDINPADLSILEVDFGQIKRERKEKKAKQEDIKKSIQKKLQDEFKKRFLKSKTSSSMQEPLF